jgi:F1-F0 ATPase (N-ATPase) AtpR subunit
MDASPMMTLSLGPAVASLVLEFASAFSLGVAIGVVHHFLLWRNVQMLAGNGSPAKVAAGQVARLLVSGATFAVAARFGALPVLAAFLGFSAIRMEAVRRVQSPS